MGLRAQLTTQKQAFTCVCRKGIAVSLGGHVHKHPWGLGVSPH